MSTRFIFVRHGATPATVERRFAGLTDVPLNAEGLEQAATVAKRLRPVRIDVVHCSPLTRCRQTAEAIMQTTGHKPRIVDDIRECHFGEWENLSIQEVMDGWPEPFGAWVGDEAVPPPGGESWGQVAERVKGWFDEASERYKDRTVLAVTHGGVILAAARMVSQSPYRALFGFEVDPCSVTIIQSRGPLWRLRLLNDTTHIHDPLLEGPPPRPMPP